LIPFIAFRLAKWVKRGLFYLGLNSLPLNECVLRTNFQLFSRSIWEALDFLILPSTSKHTHLLKFDLPTTEMPDAIREAAKEEGEPSSESKGKKRTALPTSMLNDSEWRRHEADSMDRQVEVLKIPNVLESRTY